MKVGDFGLGQNGSTPVIPTDGSAIGSGFYRSSVSEDNVYGNQVALVRLGWNSSRQAEFGGIISGSSTRFLGRVQIANNTWSQIVEFYHQQSILGTVSQTAGVPTGRLIEQGSNANGQFRRFACGLQICWRTDLSAPNANTALGSVFRSGNVTWTFPAVFAVAASVMGSTDDPDAWATTAAPTTTSVVLRVLAGVTKAAALPFRAVAIGRWFV